MTDTHKWKFVRIGGLDQVIIRDGADLLALDQLDQKLWVALSCPVKGLHLDEKTLALLDSNGDGRIRVPELLAAIKWTALHLKDVGDLLKGSDVIPLEALNPDTVEGLGTKASAKVILEGLGKPEATAVSLAEAADTVKIFSATRLNGDGVVTPASTDNTALAQLILDIVKTTGGVPDRSGAKGVDQATLDAFLAAATAFAAWTAVGQTPEVLPFGEKTAAAAACVGKLKAKIDDFFGRTRVAAFDSRALASLNKSEADLATLATMDLSVSASEMRAFPIAHVEPGRALPLVEGVNPAWSAELAELRDSVVPLVLGAARTELTVAEWESIKKAVAPHDAWIAAKAGASVESLGAARVQEVLESPLREELIALIQADKALEAQFNSIHGVERLARYQRDFRTLLNNFVNFTDFYSPDRLAVFQAGTLYLDSRSTELCLQVAAPSPLAAMSKAYIAYCDCKRADLPPIKIAACFTQGDSDFLFVGRNGVFYDRQGRDWDATITAVVENPISIRQSFWLPYKKFVRFFEEQVAKRAAAADAASTAKLQGVATQTATAGTTPAGPGAKPKFEVGTIAALGVGLGAIGTLVGGFVAGFLGLGFYMPLGVVGILLLISGPSMLIAGIKLRQRTLGPILDANGWAINGRVKINIPFGTRLTEHAKLPENSQLSLDDPYADLDAIKRRRNLTILLVLTGIFYGVVAWFYGAWPFINR